MEDRRGGRKAGLGIEPGLPGRAGCKPLGVEDIVLTAEHPRGQKGTPFSLQSPEGFPQRSWGPGRQSLGEGEDIWEKKDEQ